MPDIDHVTGLSRIEVAMPSLPVRAGADDEIRAARYHDRAYMLTAPDGLTRLVHSGMTEAPPGTASLFGHYAPPAARPDAESQTRQSSRWWLAFAMIATAVLVAPTLGYGLGYDQGLVAYEARTILHGRWLYVDVFDTVFPGAPLLHALTVALAGNAVLPLRVMDCLIQVAAGGLLYSVGRRLAGPLAGTYAACAYAALYVTGGFYQTMQRDGFMVPLILLSLVLLWQYWAHPERWALVWLSGLSLGLACTIRPTYAILAPAGSLALLLHRSPSDAQSREQRARCIRAAVAFTVVAALPLLTIVLVYLSTGHGHALGQMLTYTATVSTSLEQSTRFSVLTRFVKLGRKAIWAGALLSVFSPAWRTRRAEMLSLVGLLGCMIVIRLWESKGIGYHYWPPFACLALFAGAGWSWLGARVATSLRVPSRRVALVTGVIVATALLAQIGRSGVRLYAGLPTAVRATASDTNFRAFIADDPQQAALARYLMDHTSPADSIQLWGAETMILVAADRWSATRFTDPFYLFCQSGAGQHIATHCGGNWPRPIQDVFRNEIVTGLTTHPPKYIVAHYVNGSLAFEAGADAAPDLPELRALIDRSYVAEVTFGNWTAYRRRG